WGCPLEKTAVCKHWLRGLRKKGDGCDFLHDYDATKMPECYFHAKFGKCSNKDCPFLHSDATSSPVGCPWYDRGFCWNGPLCKYQHTRRVMCTNYLVGFCPEGPKCKFMHSFFPCFCPSFCGTEAVNCPSCPVSPPPREPVVLGGWSSWTWLLVRRMAAGTCHPWSPLHQSLVIPSTRATPKAAPWAHRTVLNKASASR
uniref:Cleavage and polyadenylation specificity factor subunit 4 n=1 Tax=Athene cunicularia TaxID=194338 RepID=A0A663M6A7_ATHCN